MFYPYITLLDGIEVTHTPIQADNHVTIHFEKPDAVLCFKTLDVSIPGYTVINRYGFTDDEVSELIQFCACNAASIIKYAQTGGILNKSN